MSDLNNEILEAIQRNLPGMMANELAQYLEATKKDKNDLAVIKMQLKTTEEAFRLKVDELASEKVARQLAEAELAEGMQLVKNAKQIIETHELKLMQVKLDAAQNQTNTVIRLVEKVFGHPSVTVAKSGQIPVAMIGGGVTTTYSSESETTIQSKV